MEVGGRGAARLVGLVGFHLVGYLLLYMCLLLFCSLFCSIAWTHVCMFVCTSVSSPSPLQSKISINGFSPTKFSGSSTVKQISSTLIFIPVRIDRSSKTIHWIRCNVKYHGVRGVRDLDASGKHICTRMRSCGICFIYFM